MSAGDDEAAAQPAPARLVAALADRYRIERELGAGGMATVYLAEDLKHRRRVAVKVLKPELAAVLGADRFVQEITTTAALQHPHILPLFDSGEADGFLFYVMPFIDGETLRSKLDRETQLGIDESVKIAVEVADALHYAHTQGVIHRDIKPENILLANGRPMVADFGIALAVSAAAGGRMTETGLSLGTPHYMSPEQATAEKEIGARSDVYSLASVLYELLTGNPPHTGASAQQIIMKIVTEEAAPVTKLRKSVPNHVAAAVAMALEKLPADRFESARAFGAALTDPGFTSGAAAAAGNARPDVRRWLSDRRTLATVAVALVVSVAAFASGRLAAPPANPTQVIRFTVEPDPALGDFLTYEDSHGPPRVSPDGRSVAFAGLARGNDQLLIRRLDQFENTVVPGGGNSPFYSPDGRWLGFMRGPQVWRVAVTGGDPVMVGSLAGTDWYWTGYVWHEGGVILVTTRTGLYRLPETGGDPVLVLAADSAAGELIGNPVSLDEARVMVEVSVPGQPTRLEAVAIATGERTRFPETVVAPAALTGDVIVFGSDPVRAARFDRRTLTLSGQPIPVAGIPAGATVSTGGSVAWFDNSTQINQLVWVTPDGAEVPLDAPPARYRWPRLAPGGTALAYGILEASTLSWLWTRDLVTGTRVRLGTRLGGTEPVWTPAGTALVFASGIVPYSGLLMQRADAGQPPDTLYPGPVPTWPTDISPDGATLAYYSAMEADENDLMFMTIADRSIRRVPLPGGQRGARFSPDGRWLAYESTESGSAEIYVKPWPAMDAKWVVSTGGGREPVWARDGRRLFFRNADQVLAVEILAGSSFAAAPPREVVRGGWFSDPYGDQSWDVAPDGRFLFLRPAPGSRVQVRVIRDWISEFRASLDASTRSTPNANTR